VCPLRFFAYEGANGGVSLRQLGIRYGFRGDYRKRC
jgi:hypothetical protein